MGESQRSLLLVRMNADVTAAKFLETTADAAVVDLTDMNAGARSGAGDTVQLLIKSGITVQARVGSTRNGAARDDLDAVIQPGLAAAVLTGVREPQDVRDADVLLREFELDRGIDPGATGLIPAIETARTLLRCGDLVGASDRTVALALDTGSLMASSRLVRRSDGRELDYARSHIATVSSAYGVVAFDVVPAGISDPSEIERDSQLVRAFGFTGRYISNPEHAGIMNMVFT